MKRRFVQCDVFTATPTRGNALAVVADSADLSDQQMQAFAAWTNLAETTFLLPPTDAAADYRVRIFTPAREMPFAGHPTLGSCAAWLHLGGTPHRSGVVVQQCEVGLIEIDLTGEAPAFAAPPTTITTMPDEQLASIADALGLSKDTIVRSALLNNGPAWQVLELRHAADVLAVDSSRVSWPLFKPIGLIGKYESGHPVDFEVRMLAPSSGMSEDPITGSLNAAIAHWFASLGEVPRPMLASQGQCIDRQGRIYWRPEKDQHGAPRMMIGGQTHILIDGELEL